MLLHFDSCLDKRRTVSSILLVDNNNNTNNKSSPSPFQGIVDIMKTISFAFLVPLLLVLFDLVPLGRSEPARSSAVRFAAKATQEALNTITSSSSHRGAADDTANLVPRELKGKKRTKAPATKKMKSATKRPKAPKSTKRPKAPKKSKANQTVVGGAPTAGGAPTVGGAPTAGGAPTVSSSQPTVKPSFQPSNPFDWLQIGADIDGEAAVNNSGKSVSLSSNGTVVAIGAIYNNGVNGTSSGHVRVYEYNGSSWDQMGTDIDGEAASDRSGWSVSLSDDGTILAIGATSNDGNGSNSGHVRVYEWDFTSWNQRGSDLNGEAASDGSGSSVSLSGDGNFLAIGAPSNDGNGSNSGHVRVYEWDGTTWNQRGSDLNGEAASDYSGYSVSLSDDGSIVAIGAYYNDGINGIDSGHVRVYEWDGTTWVQKGLDIDGEAANDYSGASVSLSSDGTVLAIGAYNNDGSFSDAGHVRVYEWDGSSAWQQKGTDIDGEAACDLSGHSVSLSSDGTVLAIGAPGNDDNGSNSGHVRVYEWDGTTWVQKGLDIDGEAAGDKFGASVSLSSDGTFLAIGAPSNAAGHVRVHEYTN